MAARVNKDEFEGKVLKSDIPVLVDFYSDSCVPCKKMTPVIGDVEDDMEGKLAVYKVNINFDTELAESYDVQSVPTLLLFDKGSEKARQSGAVRKPQLVEWIEENMKITVSGTEKEVKDGLTLPELIEMENVETPEYVTVSINEEFVESAAKDSTVLKDGDNVEFLYFMGGGSYGID